jgi:hypothetical protein
MSEVVSRATNILDESPGLLEDVLIFDDDVITGLWIRYHKLYVLLPRSVFKFVMRLDSSHGLWLAILYIPPKIHISLPLCHMFGAVLREMGRHRD